MQKNAPFPSTEINKNSEDAFPLGGVPLSVIYRSLHLKTWIDYAYAVYDGRHGCQSMMNRVIKTENVSGRQTVRNMFLHARLLCALINLI